MQVSAIRLPRRHLLAGSLAPFLATRSARAAERAGDVDALRGEATAQAGGATRPLAPNAIVFVGDTVATAAESAIALHLGAATVVRLGAEARLRIDQFLVKAGGVFMLAKGGMLFEHDPAAGAPEAAIRTPFGLIAVRGTRLFAGPSNNVFGVFVFQGEVTVVGRNTSVQVLPGFGADIAAADMEPTAPRRWAEARIKAAEASVR